MCPKPRLLARRRALCALLPPLWLGWLPLAQSAQGQEPEVSAPPAVVERESRVDYTIEALLDGATKQLDGKLSLAWTNSTADEVPDLWFHLYHNAFANNQSTHLWESEGKLRNHLVEQGWGWQRIDSLRVGGVDLTPRLQFQRPDDGREQDFSVVSVALERPVAPGQTLEVELHWSAQLPRVRRRTGYKDDFLLVAHWFPKLGVYEEGRGWNCHQFHMNTEFYADYGTYDVTLDLPIEYAGKVGASGVAYGPPTLQGDRVRTRFLAPSREDRGRVDASGRAPLVHGFAWTADPTYSVHVSTFNYDEWAERFEAEVQATASSLGVDKEALRLRNVTVEVMMQPERAEQWERHFEATCTALFFYGLWFGEYPYEKITVVDPAWGAGAAGGMEYPTLFTCGTKLLTRPRMYRPESVTVHEAGHQFWYGLVGNNEFENAWMDEGFNSYTDSEALFRRYGTERGTTSYSGLPIWGVRPSGLPGGGAIGDVLSGRGFSLPGSPTFEPLVTSPFVDWWRDQPRLTFVEETTDPRWEDRSAYLSAPDRDPIITPGGWTYLDRASYRCNSYPRPAVALRSLAAVVGRDAFLRGMRHYSQAWRYRHPYPQDFFEAFNEGAGVDVGWYFEDLFESTHTLDWSLKVSQRRAPIERGYFLDPDGQWQLRAEVPEPRGEDVVLAGEDVGLHPEPAEELVETQLPVEASEPRAPAGEATQPSQATEPESPDPAPQAEPPATVASPETASAADASELPVGIGGPGPDQEVEPRAASEDAESRPWIYDVVVRRAGELRLPVTIEVIFEKGGRERFEWTREQQALSAWWRLPIESRMEKLKAVVIDPERLYFLDGDMSDNQWYEEVDHTTPLRWGERILSQYTQLFHWYASIGG